MATRRGGWLEGVGDAPQSEVTAFAVCIVTHNSAADLPGCLEAVARLAHRPLEIVVVDCASTDGSLEAARRRAPPADIPSRSWSSARTSASPAA